MKTKQVTIAWLFIFLLCAPTAHAQILKKLKKRAEEAAKETVLQKVEEKAAEETGRIMDTILDADKKIKKKKKKKRKSATKNGQDPMDEDETPQGDTLDSELTIYSKFDFVPGNKQVFFDEFSSDYVGDFPSKWNTNGSGEVVGTSSGTEKWLEMKPGYGTYYIPKLPELPEAFTIEFDLMATGLDNKTASTTVLKIILSDDTGFKLGNYAYAQISFCQYAAVGLWVRNSSKEINNQVKADIREALLNRPHISVAVNKQRLRLWVNQQKVVDIPSLLPPISRSYGLKFELNNFKAGKEQLFITNLKLAEGGQDLRSKLIAEGRVSTNAILFKSGSATLQPKSMGIIRQISQVLKQESDLNLNIVGHTDADGNDAKNLALSKQRAEAVKNTLVSIYGIDSARLDTEGKGETEPVADNSTTEGKAQNRRVEFIKV
ncbi:OmpA family protein [Hwangdonia lutea]|uniref:OmpA family protein n=1 Tax=Hwangdonia lutea TaxID=3075823 RepID=A0AA97EN48_9FLAO|nr:OmpA family protein [Hwangdonia sp. SCSIO 19198]WOD43519.1 OmpA family protein [Hwangdonia sp. SCSIO 19198]